MQDFGVRIRCIMGDVQVANATFLGVNKLIMVNVKVVDSFNVLRVCDINVLLCF